MKNIRVLYFLLCSVLLITFSNCSEDSLSNNNVETSVSDDALAKKGGKGQSATNNNSNSNNTGTGTKLEQVTEDENNSYSVYSHSLWAGQDSYAGEVIVTNNDNELSITYNTDASADLKEVHIYVWDHENIVPNKRPAPGKAPYKAENLNADIYSISIPKTIVCDRKFYISTHAALIQNGTEEDPEDDGDGDDNGDNDNDDNDDDGDNGENDPDFKTIAPKSNAGETAYAGGLGFTSQKGAWWGYFEYVVECSDDDGGVVTPL